MSVQDLMILRGRVASDIALHRSQEEGVKPFARFRMAVPRARRRDDGQWEDGEPQWFTVKSWGVLAEHAELSLRRGAPIVVIGRPAAQYWINKDGEAQGDIAIHAVTFGHDLVFGVASFSRLRREPTRPAPEEIEDAEERDEEGSEVEDTPTELDLVLDQEEKERKAA